MEIPMPSYSLCCLGSLNLTKFVENPFTEAAFFDFKKMREVITIAVRFLDNVLDATQYPLEKIETFSKQWRRIGLGFTGLGDALAMLRLKYGEKESIEFCEKFGASLRNNSYRASVLLAQEKGMAPGLRTGLFHNKVDPRLKKGDFIKRLPEDIQLDISKYGLRNIGMNTTAPTGCIVPDTKIQTSLGALSIKNIIEQNGFLVSEIEDTPGWYIPTKEILVATTSGLRRILKLFVNGYKEILSINDGVIKGTPNHRILVLRDQKILWIPLKDLKIGDNILQKKK